MNMGQYMGVPSIYGRVTNTLFRSLFDHMNSRLAGWRTKHLKLAGRIVLAKSVLCTVPYFTMQTVLFPEGVCDVVDKRIRSFIWGSSSGQRKCHLINWDTITKTKDVGGLGIRSTNSMNKAFLAKLVWHLLTHTNSMWAQVLARKYMQGIHHMDNIHIRLRASNVWRGMVSAKQVVADGCRHVSGMDVTQNFGLILGYVIIHSLVWRIMYRLIVI